MSDPFKGKNHILKTAAQASGKLKRPRQQQQGQSADRQSKPQQQGDNEEPKIPRTGFEQPGGM